MDKLDISILSQLLQHSRDSNTALGKAVRLSRENIFYRLQQLEKHGIIKSYVTEIDYRKLGFMHTTIYVRFDALTPAAEKAFLNYLHTHKAVNWVGVLAGKWSVTFDVYVRSAKEFQQIMQELSEYPILQYATLDVHEAQYFFEKLIGAKPVQKKTVSAQHALDAQDLRILAALSDNSRATYVELAQATKLSANTIKYRIQQLQKTGVIGKYTISIDYKALGYEWYGIQVSLVKGSAAAHTKLKSVFAQHPNVIFYYQYVANGTYDYDIGVVVKNSKELRALLDELRGLLASARIDNVFLVLEESSSHSLPPAVFDAK